MIESVTLKDVTIFEAFEWEGLSNVNLVIGENDTGKSNLLKMLYAVTKSLLEYSRDPGENDWWGDQLAQKLKWTFLPPKLELGKIVRKGGDRLEVECRYRFHGRLEEVAFDFGPRTKKQIGNTSAFITDRQDGAAPDVPLSVFFPPKEVLTTRDAIIETRERLSIPGFDDTYYDLAKALRSPESYGEIDASLKGVLKELEGLFRGHIEEEDGELVYRRGREKYGIAQTAEGIKNVEALRLLIRSQHIQKGSVLFFDEPSANLHPELTLDFVELLFHLAQAGVQLFIATHSYVVLKQFELLARKHGETMPLCVLSPAEDGVDARFADLSDRIPQNSIVDASVELFERDVSLELDG